MSKKNYSKLIIGALIAVCALLLGSAPVLAESAAKLNFGTKVSGNISKEIPSQTYQVTLEKPGKIEVDFTSKINEVYIQILDEEGDAVTSKNSIYYGSLENPKKWQHAEYLEAGIYYIKINQYREDTGEYSLKTEFEQTNNNEIEPNNGLEDAEPLHLNAEKKTGLISWSDAQDYYKLVIAEPGQIKIDFTSSINEVYVQILDAEGNAVTAKQSIYYGSPGEPKKWQHAEYLEAGTYYIKIDQYRGDTGVYTLKAEFEQTNNSEIEPNNGIKEAELLNFNAEKKTGLISWSDSQDFYKFVLSEPGQIKIDFTSSINEVYIQVLDAEGDAVIAKQSIYYGSPQEPKKWLYAEYLEAGTYYIKISQYREDTGSYTLKADFEETKNTEKEPNNGIEEAQNYSLNQKITGLISRSDSSDVYKLTIDKTANYHFMLSSSINEVYFQLLDADGDNVIGKTSIYYGSPQEPKKWNAKVELHPGNYYIKILQYRGDTGKYDLNVIPELKDIQSGEYYYDSVVNLTSKGIISGYADGTFRPNQPLSRAHTILLLKRALNLEVPANYKEIAGRFSDVGENYQYAQEVAAVYQAGIFLGSNGKMDLHGKLTREQMASVIVRAFELKDASAKNDLQGVKDAPFISPSHKKDVEIFYQLGITKGKADGRYGPKESVTRGQFATFLNRTMEVN